jgi:hypothetical protein
MTQRAALVKYNLELLIKFCSDNHITLLKDYSDEKITRETIIQCKCLREGCGNSFEKNFRQFYNTNGYCEKCTKNVGNKKFKVTCLEKYGVECPSQSQEVKDKCKATCLENHGVEHYSQN